MRSILIAVGFLLATPAVSYAQFYAPTINWGVRNSLGVQRGTTRLEHSEQKLRVESSRSRTLETFTDGDTTYSGLRSRDKDTVGTRQVDYNGEGRITGWSMSNSPDSHGFASMSEVEEDNEDLPLGGEELKLDFTFEGL